MTTSTATAAQDRYVTIDNGNGTHSVRDTTANRWLELNGREDMLPHQAASLRTEYELGDQ